MIIKMSLLYDSGLVCQSVRPAVRFYEIVIIPDDDSRE